MASKRARQTITLDLKLKIIEARRSNESNRAIAHRFGLAKSTVSTIWKNRKSIEKATKCSFPAKASKSSYITAPLFAKVDTAVFRWFAQQRSKGTPINGPLLQKKARIFGELLYPGKTFRASDGWLHKFKCRHGISLETLQGELSANTTAVEPFTDRLKHIIKENQLTKAQIFNADETVLWWRLLPNQSLVRQEKTASDRITILGCTNAAGTCKIPLVCIHKAKGLQGYQNEDMKKLPVTYFSHHSALMDPAIFKTWFHEHFVPVVRSFCQANVVPFKVVLLIDNAPSHPLKDQLICCCGSVWVEYLPLTTTSQIQPMNQGVLEPLKRRYKKSLLHHILAHDDADLSRVIKNLNIKDAVGWISQSWKEATQDNIRSSWRQILQDIEIDERPGKSNEPIEGNGTIEVDNSGDIYEIKDMFAELGYVENDEAWLSPEEWLREDECDPCHQLLSEEDIVELASFSAEDESDETVAENEVEPSIPASIAFAAADTLMSWLEAQGNTDPLHILQVRNWRDQAAKLHADNLRQNRLQIV
ncbi:jerky protein homolog-like [Anneissia japonica]|uniref:jerky protein homolog-like n=1 Tax=Anneissia japonica TaxID=1529436 RepID=UPI0014258C55|nr:jerky protein homolog-like [Anneissia japonica]